jgi:NADPH-dependent ferric siderophore reductase
MNDGPRTTRVRHELKRRKLTVARIERLPPKMIRVVLRGEELQGFTSRGFDDHIKVIFPPNDPAARDSSALGGAIAPCMRDFTPRHFDATAGELWIDFFLHDAGPAAAWAAQASAGQTLEIGGPRGSAVIALEGIDAHVLIGDETAIPAISRRLEELPPDSQALVAIETDAHFERPVLASRAAMTVVWVARDGRSGSPARELIDTLRTTEFPPGHCFVWVAIESRAARAIRNYLREERGLDKQWIKAAGYWQRGAVGTHDRIADEA